MVRAKANKGAAMVAVSAPKSAAEPATIASDAVARRAYDLYLGRGCEHGHDVDDWVQAERELRQTPPSTAA